MLTFVILAALHAAPPVSPDGAVRLPGLTLTLESIRRDTGAPCLATVERAVFEGPQVRVARRCGVEEVWTSVADSLEHELFLARSPVGRGALRISLRVDGPWHHADARGHTFAGPGASDGWTYGEAFVIRGARRERIEVMRTPTGLELVVPAALVKFPLHIDPLVFPNAERGIALPLLVVGGGPSPSDEATPSVTWNSAGTYGVVAFSDDRRGSFPDLFGVVASFDAGVVLSNLVPAPAAQLRPAVVSVRDGGLVVAFEDYVAGALSAPSVRVALLDEVTKTPRASKPISNARAPSLTFDPQLGAVLAYAKNETSPVVCTVDSVLFGDGGVFFELPLAGVVEDTAVASGDGHREVAIATTDGRVRFFRDGAEQVFAAPSVGVRQSSPSVIILPSGARSYAWAEQGPAGINPSVQLRMFDPNANVTVTEFNDDQASLVEFQGRTLLLTFSPPALGPRELRVRDVSGGIRVMSAFPVGRSLGLGELSTEARGDQVLVAWTDRTPLEQRNLDLGILRCCDADGGFEGSFPPIDAVPTQHDVAVAYADEVGLVVWREGANIVRAQWVDGRTQTIGSNFFVADAGLAARVDGLDVSVGKDDALVVARTFLGDAPSQVATFRVPKLATTATRGPGIDLTLADRPTPPRVAFGGSKYWVGVRRLGGYHLLETDGINNANPSMVTASSNAESFDLDCLDGHCVLAFVEPGMREVRLVPDLTQPEVTTVTNAPGPVTVTNDGARFHLVWQAPDPQGMGAVLVSASFDPGDVPLPGGDRATPLVDSAGNVVLAATIDAAGTQPLVVAVSDGNLPPRTHLVELGGTPPWRRFDGASGARATATSAQASTGVLVYQRFDVDRLASESMILSWDELRRDGGVDGGADAGPGTTPSGDGGSDGGAFNLTSSGCGGCSTASGGAWLFALLALGALIRRKVRP